MNKNVYHYLILHLFIDIVTPKVVPLIKALTNTCVNAQISVKFSFYKLYLLNIYSLIILLFNIDIITVDYVQKIIITTKSRCNMYH